MLFKIKRKKQVCLGNPGLPSDVELSPDDILIHCTSHSNLPIFSLDTNSICYQAMAPACVIMPCIHCLAPTVNWNILSR